MSKISKLNDHIFDALDKLSKCEDIDEIKSEVQRCNAISNAGKVVVEQMKIATDIAKLQEKGNDYTEYVLPSLLGLGDENE